MAEQFLRIHLLVRDDADGPIHSAPVKLGKMQLGTKSRWRAACDPAITMNELNRGTTEPWAVRCESCEATEDFKKIDRPHPREQSANLRTAPRKRPGHPPASIVIEDNGDGCCG